MKRILSAITLLFFVLSMTSEGASASAPVMPHVSSAMLNESFWISKLQDADKVILSVDQIAKLNKDTAAHLANSVFDLRMYPGELTKEQLTALITLPKNPGKKRYIGNREVEGSFYSELAAQCNIKGIASTTRVRYGLTVTRSDIRTFPTATCVTSAPNDTNFDIFQETAIDPSEPVIILHESLNRKWLFVQSYNYRGWVDAGSVAVAGAREEWLEYVDYPEFLTVIASKIRVGDIDFAMGAKLRLADERQAKLAISRNRNKGKYTIKLPVRGPNGEMAFELAAVSADKQVIEGYLPYTRANILSQAFKMYGEPYGWGGLNGGRDCSAFILDVYRSFGFILPRNADEQEAAAGQTITFKGERAAQLGKLAAGGAIYMPGHAMLYLGEHSGRHYIIHDLGGYFTDQERVTVRAVVVSDVSLKLSSGKEYLDALTTGKQFQ